MKPTDRIIYERGFGPGDGDSHVERVEPAMTRTVSPSPEQLERCDDQEMIERLTYLMQFYVSTEAEEKDVRDLVSSFGADDGYSGYAIVKESALEAAQAEIARLTTALSWFDKHGEHLANDVSSGHSARGSAASGWMREDDADFRSDLREALANARAALKETSHDPA